MRFLLKYFAGIIIPIVLLLVIGIIHKHLGLIIGSLILGLESFYILIMIVKELKKNEGKG